MYPRCLKSVSLTSTCSYDCVANPDRFVPALGSQPAPGMFYLFSSPEQICPEIWVGCVAIADGCLPGTRPVINLVGCRQSQSPHNPLGGILHGSVPPSLKQCNLWSGCKTRLPSSAAATMNYAGFLCSRSFPAIVRACVNWCRNQCWICHFSFASPT